MRLRVLDFGHQSALRSQAVYHGVAAALGADNDPVLTLVNPSEPYVCVGMHQEVGLEVDEDYCRREELPIIRRHVGGGAVYLDSSQMFFHFIYPRGRVPAPVSEIYPLFIEPVVRTYHQLGVGAVFRPINDIHVDGRKIGGTGAACIENAAVMVGSFMFDFDVQTMARCLKVPSEKFRDKLRSGLRDYMTTMRRELEELPARETVKDRFLEQVEACLGVTPVADEPTAREMAAIEEQERLLSDPEWTYRLGRKFVGMGVKIAAGTHVTENAYKAPGGLIRVHLLERESRVADLLLSGDFTVLPENGVDRLAERLKGVALEAAVLRPSVEKAMEELRLDMPGVEAEHVAQAILDCVHRD